MRDATPLSNFLAPEPTPEELAERKRISDRAELLAHIDHLLRPPGWVYREIEQAIRQAIAGNLTAKIKSRDGHDYGVADLVEGWKLEPMLGVYRRPLDDPSYQPE